MKTILSYLFAFSRSEEEPHRAFHQGFIHAAAIIAIIIIGIAIYANSISGPFIFDDIGAIVGNDQIKNNAVFRQWNEPRYVGLISFALNYRFSNLDTFSYHIINTVIHILNAILLYFLLVNIFTLIKDKILDKYRVMLPFFIALIFLVHPVQTQAVTYIVQRFSSMAGLFVLLAVLFYIKFRMLQPERWWLYVLSLACSALAFKTKENTATLPLMIFVIECIFFRNSGSKLRHRIMLLIPYCVLVALIPASFMHLNKNFGELMGEMREKSYETVIMNRYEYFVTELRVIMKYISLLIAPVNQSLDYFFPLSRSLFEARAFMSFCFILCLIAVSILLYKKYPIISFGILWFFIFLFVESSIIPIRDVIFEHRVYLPSIGFLTVLVYILFLIMHKINVKGLSAVFTIIVIILSVLTVKRNEIWNNEIALWREASARYPQNMRSHINLGYAYMKKGMCKEAIEELSVTLKDDIYHGRAHKDLANCYRQEGLITQATEEYNRAINIDHSFMHAYTALASLYLEAGNVEEAFKVLLDSTKYGGSSNAEVNAMLGSIYCTKKDFMTASDHFIKSIKIDSHYSGSYLFFGFCLLEKGEVARAKEMFLQVTSIDPEFLDAYYYIALCFDKEGKVLEAINYYTTFLEKEKKPNPLIAQIQARLKELQ